MINFAKSYQAGLDAARIAEKNKREIDSVFNEMNRQLSEATNGKIKVYIKTLYGKPDGLTTLQARYGYEPKAYTGIVAENPDVADSARELARWSQDRNGYPCTITLGSNSRSCGDKLALEKALAEMLSDPIVGKALSELVSIPIPERPKTKTVIEFDDAQGTW